MAAAELGHGRVFDPAAFVVDAFAGERGENEGGEEEDELSEAGGRHCEGLEDGVGWGACVVKLWGVEATWRWSVECLYRRSFVCIKHGPCARGLFLKKERALLALTSSPCTCHP